MIYCLTTKLKEGAEGALFSFRGLQDRVLALTRVSKPGQGIAARILHGSNRVVQVTGSLIAHTFGFELAVAGELPCGFLDVTYQLFSLALY